MRAYLIVCVVCGSLVAAGGAVAQVYPTPEDMGLNYTFYAGAAFLTNSVVNNNTVPSIGFSYFDSAGENFGQMAAFGLTADWSLIERNDGEDVNLVALLFNYRQYAFISSYRVFAELGIGMLALTDGISDMKLSTGANFGWTGGVGFDITNNLCLRGRFIGGQNPSDDGMASVQLGYRF